MREEIVQEAVVLSVAPDRIMVRVDRKDEDCGGCRACALKSLCRGKEADHMDLPVPVDAETPELAPGETVRIAYRAANRAVAALVMFLPALLGVFFGGFAANALAGEGDGIFLLGCFSGLALGVLFTFVAARSSGALKPEIRLLSR